MINKMRVLYLLSVLFISVLATSGVNFLSATEEEPTHQRCYVIPPTNGICVKQTSGTTSRMVCVDLLEGETSNCTKPTIEP